MKINDFLLFCENVHASDFFVSTDNFCLARDYFYIKIILGAKETTEMAV